MSSKSQAGGLQAYSLDQIARARAVAKHGALVALLSVIIFVCFAVVLAMATVGGGHSTDALERVLRVSMTLALLGFFVGSHVWQLAPFKFQRETSRRRLESYRRLTLTCPEVGALAKEIDSQRRSVLRGEVDQVLRKFKKRLAEPLPRMRAA